MDSGYHNKEWLQKIICWVLLIASAIMILFNLPLANKGYLLNIIYLCVSVLFNILVIIKPTKYFRFIHYIFISYYALFCLWSGVTKTQFTTGFILVGLAILIGHAYSYYEKHRGLKIGITIGIMIFTMFTPHFLNNFVGAVVTGAYFIFAMVAFIVIYACAFTIKQMIIEPYIKKLKKSENINSKLDRIIKNQNCLKSQNEMIKIVLSQFQDVKCDYELTLKSKKELTEKYIEKLSVEELMQDGVFDGERRIS